MNNNNGTNNINFDRMIKEAEMLKENDVRSEVQTPFGAILQHRRNLDDVLISFKGYSDETKAARNFIVGQIEALDFCIRMLE